MIPCCVLTGFHPMVGCDFEATMPPGSPSPLPSPTPYFTMQILFGLFPKLKSKPTDKTLCSFGIPLQEGTDIGYLIPHLGAPNVLIPLVWAFSSSKSLFSASTVEVEGKAVSTARNILTNVNLNCGTPVSTPSGMVIAPNTFLAGMTIGDFVAGESRMLAQMALSFLLSKLGDKVFQSTPIAMGMIRASTSIFGPSIGQFVTRSVFREAYKGIVGGLTAANVDIWTADNMPGNAVSPDDSIYGAGSSVGKWVDRRVDKTVNYLFGTNNSNSFGGGQLGGGGAGQNL